MYPRRLLSYQCCPLKAVRALSATGQHTSRRHVSRHFSSSSRTESDRTVAILHQNTNGVNTTLKLALDDGQQLEFPYPWLRESCPNSLNPATYQRSVSLVTQPGLNSGVKNVNLKSDNKAVVIDWVDGHKSTMSVDWLEYQSKKQPSHTWNDELTTWSKHEFQDQELPQVIYDPNWDKSRVRELAQKIAQYGFCFVVGMPACPKETRKIGELFGGQLSSNPLWGDFWDYVVDTGKLGDIADTAYTGEFIPPHTDGTYLQDSPGLQFFHVLDFKGTGGLSQLVDGFNIAAKLKQKSPELYDFLSTYPFEWYHKSPVTYYRTFEPVFSTDYRNHPTHIRFNDLDRAPPPSTLDKSQLDLYYKSLQAYAELILQKENQLEFRLEPGKLLIVNNWRVMHGRSPFTGHRRICGCYVAMDQFRNTYSVETNDEVYV